LDRNTRQTMEWLDTVMNRMGDSLWAVCVGEACVAMGVMKHSGIKYDVQNTNLTDDIVRQIIKDADLLYIFLSGRPRRGDPA
jgi:NADH:ubiquinone oxidoreductase subunit B-like Fe-S oxidoreductase